MILMEFCKALFLAAFLGALIGLERQWRQKSAGLKTNTLVALGSAAFTLISYTLAVGHGGIQKVDPTRVIGQIVSGIGFLGAGVIFKEGLSVLGLNTAATIWCSAAVGALAGVGLYAESTIVALFVVMTHIAFRPLAKFVSRNRYEKRDTVQTEYLMTIKCKSEVENHLRILLLKYLNEEDRLLLKSISSVDNGDPSRTTITAEILAISQQDSLMEKIASRLTIEEKVYQVSWEVIGSESEY